MTTTQKITAYIIVMLISYTCSSNLKDEHEEGPDIENITNYENIIRDSLVTMAIINPTYQEIVQEVYGAQTTVGYVYDYSYRVDEETYNGSVEVKDSFNYLKPVFYLKENPAFHSFFPKKELKGLVQEGEENDKLYLSYFFLSVCALAFIGIIVAIIKSVKRKKKEKIEHERKKADRVVYLNSLKNK
jgi:hypothetical protein